MLELLFTKSPFAFLTTSFWRDEAFSYLLASKPFLQIPFLTAQDFSPPLYYLVLHVWMKLFGHSEVAIRSLSLLFFVLTAYFAHDIVTELFRITNRRKWAYFTLLLMSPFLGYYAMEARMYSMLGFFAVSSWYLLLKHKWRWYVAAVVAGIYTHYFMILVFGSQFVYALLSPRSSSIRKRVWRNSVAAAALCVPWALFVLFQRPPVQSQFWITKPTGHDLLMIPVMMLTGIERPAAGMTKTLFTGITVFLWLYAALMVRRLVRHAAGRDILRILLTWIFVPILTVLAVTLVKPLYLPRYIIFTSAGFLLLLFIFFEHSKPRVRTALIILLGIFFVYYHHYQLVHKSKQNIRSTVREINALMNPGDVIFVDSELNFHPVQYYASDPKNVYIVNKSYQEIPAYVGKVLIPREHIAFNPPPFPRRAFIISSDLTYDVQATR